MPSGKLRRCSVVAGLDLPFIVSHWSGSVWLAWRIGPSFDVTVWGLRMRGRALVHIYSFNLVLCVSLYTSPDNRGDLKTAPNGSWLVLVAMQFATRDITFPRWVVAADLVGGHNIRLRGL